MERTRQPSPRAAEAAQKLADEFGLDHQDKIDPEQIAHALEISIEYKDLPGEQGRLVRLGGTRIVVRRGLRPEQTRFVIGHELGHYRLHPDLDQLKQCTAGDMKDYRLDGIESEANRFSAELIMPERLFKPLCRMGQPSLDDIESLARAFRASRMAAGIQFVRFCSAPCALVFSKNGVVQWARRSDHFHNFIESGRQLHSGEDSTYAGDLFAGKTIVDRPMPVDAKNWTGFRSAAGTDVYEHSRKWESADGMCVLSLLRDRGS